MLQMRLLCCKYKDIYEPILQPWRYIDIFHSDGILENKYLLEWTIGDHEQKDDWSTIYGGMRGPHISNFRQPSSYTYPFMVESCRIIYLTDEA